MRSSFDCLALAQLPDVAELLRVANERANNVNLELTVDRRGIDSPESVQNYISVGSVPKSSGAL